MTIRSVLLGLLLMFSLGACRKTPVPVVGSLYLDAYNTEQNLAIGNAIDFHAQSIYTSISEQEKPEAISYIQSILDLLVNTPALTNRNTYNWQISILPDTSKSTAFTLPNGHIYIYTGLLKYLETESQLLSLLAHEMTYAEKGLATLILEEEFGKKDLGDIVLDNGKADTEAMAIAFEDFSYPTNNVLAADDFSVELLCPFMYEPRGLVSIFEKAISDNENIPLWFSLRLVENLSERISRMNEKAVSCGMDGVQNAEAYQAFLLDLLE